jgi:hypothetical protein
MLGRCPPVGEQGNGLNLYFNRPIDVFLKMIGTLVTERNPIHSCNRHLSLPGTGKWPG